MKTILCEKCKQDLFKKLSKEKINFKTFRVNTICGYCHKKIHYCYVIDEIKTTINPTIKHIPIKVFNEKGFKKMSNI